MSGNYLNNSGIPLVYLDSLLFSMTFFKRTFMETELGCQCCIWASEASPTLGCSIKISRDIYIYAGMYVYRMSKHRMFKVSFGWLKLTGDTRVIHFDYMVEQL